MKIEITTRGSKYIIDTEHEDVTIDEAIEMMNNLLICVGYRQDTILTGMEDLIEQKDTSNEK